MLKIGDKVRVLNVSSKEQIRQGIVVSIFNNNLEIMSLGQYPAEYVYFKHDDPIHPEEDMYMDVLGRYVSITLFE